MSNSLGMEGMLYRVGKSGGSFTLTTVCSFPNTPGQAAAITNMSEVNNAYYFILAGIAAEVSSLNNAIIYYIHP